MSCRKGHTNNPAGVNGGGFALADRKDDIWMQGRPWLPSRVRQMSREEAAYLGGVFDADGSLYLKRTQLVTAIANNDPELISAPLRFTGTGSVSSGVKRGKLHLIWRLDRQQEVLDFLVAILPFSVKAQEALL